MGFFLKIGLTSRKNSVRVSRSSTLCLNVRAYLNTQKYGVFCSLRLLRRSCLSMGQKKEKWSTGTAKWRKQLRQQLNTLKISQHHFHLFYLGTVRAGFETPKNSIQLVSSVSYFASVGAHFIIFSVLARGYSGNWKKPFVSRSLEYLWKTFYGFFELITNYH